MEELQRRDLSVHVDYTDDMNTALTPEFVQINNVKLLVQLTDEPGIALVKNYLSDRTYASMTYTTVVKLGEQLKKLL